LDGSAKQSRRLASPGKDNAGIKRTAGSGSERRALCWIGGRRWGSAL